ncbi:MAG: UDP-glucose 4-epimerase [Verrucomicrobiales bacterium]|jgi:UDP-glucose 4-epimerase
MPPQKPIILVTGGAGFIGSHLVEHYQDSAAEIRVLDDLRSGALSNLSGLNHTFIQGSITDRDIVREAVQGVDYLFHLAAMISVPESMEEPLLCQELNVAGFLTILEEASRAGVTKAVLSSSAAIYGDNPTVPKVETMIPEPRSPYAITKLDGEYYGQLFHREGKIAFTALRYFNVFGPRQNPNSAYAAAVPIFIDRALKNEAITIYGDGEQTRDFVYVKDVAAANAFAAENLTLEGVYNVGYGQQLTINELAQRIVGETGSSSEIRHLDTRAGDVRHSLAAVERLTEAGFQPEGSVDQGLRETLAWYHAQAHPS